MCGGRIWPTAYARLDPPVEMLSGQSEYLPGAWRLIRSWHNRNSFCSKTRYCSLYAIPTLIDDNGNTIIQDDKESIYTEYAAPVWDPCHSKDIQRSEAVQKFALSVAMLEGLELALWQLADLCELGAHRRQLNLCHLYRILQEKCVRPSAPLSLYQNNYAPINVMPHYPPCGQYRGILLENPPRG